MALAHQFVALMLLRPFLVHRLLGDGGDFVLAIGPGVSFGLARRFRLQFRLRAEVRLLVQPGAFFDLLGVWLFVERTVEDSLELLVQHLRAAGRRLVLVDVRRAPPSATTPAVPAAVPAAAPATPVAAVAATPPFPAAARLAPTPITAVGRFSALLQVAVIGRLDVGDVQETVAADAEIDEGGLNAGLDVDDAALVDVPDIAFVAGALDVKLFEDAVLQDGDAYLLGLENVDEHFLFHCWSFPCGARRQSGAAGVMSQS
ncbi:MAG: hypothetical protein U0793_05315 [Gemmataceae bacterium]